MESHMNRAIFFLLFAITSCSSENPSEIQEEIKQSELKAMKGELESQGDFRENYSKFASKLSESEKEEVKAEELKKSLDK